MSDCMIIRRGGGGQGFDPNGAVLKVVTSTGCTVAVTNATAGYSKTHQQADGYPRSNNADVTEHFFSIPPTAFGTLTVTATNVYGPNAKDIDVSTAGKVYELLCGGTNIILDGTFGLQDGYTVTSYYSYSDRNKSITARTTAGVYTLILEESIPVSAYTQLSVKVRASSGYTGSIELSDSDSNIICAIHNILSNQISAYRALISGVYYPTAELRADSIYEIKEIILT